MKKVFLPLLLCCVFFAGTLTAGNVLVSGSVCDAETGKPIEIAKIKYKTAGAENYLQGTHADKDGAFQFIYSNPSFMPVSSIIQVCTEAEGYQSNETELILEPMQEEIAIQVKLKKESVLEERTFKPKYKEAGEVLRKIYQELGNDVRVDMYYGSLVVVKGTKDRLAEAESIFNEFDQPPKQIWIQVMLIHANGSDEKRTTFDPRLRTEIVKKLSTLFKFKSYTVVGQAEISGLERNPVSFSSDLSSESSVSFAVEAIPLLSEGVITLKNLKIVAMKPNKGEIMTTVNIPNGETVVLGSSRSDMEGGAMITVVTAKVM
jgi:hypothetical protein